jgi:elongation of very long chain fatty acids protein 6
LFGVAQAEMNISCSGALYRPAACVVPTARTFMEADGLKHYSFVELFQVFPWLSSLYAPIEKSFDARAGYRFVDQSMWLPVVSIALYALMIVFLPRYTKRRPLNVKKPLAYWNLFLAVFSFMGALRTVPHLLYFRATASFRDTICAKPETVFGDGATGLW